MTVCASGGQFALQHLYAFAKVIQTIRQALGAAVIPGSDPESVEMNEGLFVLEGASRIGTDPETSSG